MKALFRAITSLRFWMHILLIAIFVALTLFLVMFWLESYTQHGESIEVPDLSGYTVGEVEITLQNNDLYYEITDSVYTDEFSRGAIITQNPEGGKEVKRGRTIFLTVNSSVPELVEIPDLIGKSLRIAIPILEISGFVVDDLVYKPDDSCTDCVINLKHDGKQLTPGEKIRKGQKITIVLGRQSNIATSVPDLLGLTYRSASEIIVAQSLNVGQVIACTGCETEADTLGAFVINQIPSRNAEAKLGTYVDLYLTTDSTAVDAFKKTDNNSTDEIL
ncbi:MAG TPA: PASTA domain-containing protein [Cryomorphaceae bacterium]|nr:PASTA domain-containing protein [Cryomorphaceae bacterium]